MYVSVLLVFKNKEKTYIVAKEVSKVNLNNYVQRIQETAEKIIKEQGPDSKLIQISHSTFFRESVSSW